MNQIQRATPASVNNRRRAAAGIQRGLCAGEGTVGISATEAFCLLGKVADVGADGASAIGDQLTGPAAVCWYAKSTLVAPVFVARVKTQDATSIAALQTALGKTFGDLIGAYEAKAAKSGDAYTGSPAFRST